MAGEHGNDRRRTGHTNDRRRERGEEGEVEREDSKALRQ